MRSFFVVLKTTLKVARQTAEGCPKEAAKSPDHFKGLGLARCCQAGAKFRSHVPRALHKIIENEEYFNFSGYSKGPRKGLPWPG
jgi:hypothetical protein